MAAVPAVVAPAAAAATDAVMKRVNLGGYIR
jgi:hypothetical protein